MHFLCAPQIYSLYMWYPWLLAWKYTISLVEGPYVLERAHEAGNKPRRVYSSHNQRQQAKKPYRHNVGRRLPTPLYKITQIDWHGDSHIKRKCDTWEPAVENIWWYKDINSSILESFSDWLLCVRMEELYHRMHFSNGSAKRWQTMAMARKC